MAAVGGDGKQAQGTNPTISVVMPTHNAGKFLPPAIDSVLTQTFRDFELIVINDGSTDGTEQLLAKIGDPRLTVLSNQRNLGIATSTNRGLAIARGQYVALHDSDDISLPHRLRTEFAFLEAHREIALVGSSAILIDAEGTAYAEYVEPADDIELKWEALFRCPISHTSVMVRRRVLLDVGEYSTDPVLRVTSDYDAIARIAMRYPVANLREPLVKWRRHRNATMLTHEPQLQRGIEAISLRNISVLTSLNRRWLPDADQVYQCLGSRAFLCTPAGQLPVLPADQVIAGLRFLCDLQDAFCRYYNCPGSAGGRLRRRLNWSWGKHALALAFRAPWGWRWRAQIFCLGAGRLLAGSATGGSR
jgi:hypothetical protein